MRPCAQAAIGIESADAPIGSARVENRRRFPAVSVVSGRVDSGDHQRTAAESASSVRPDLDIDLAVESIEHPEQYPLVSQAQALKARPSTSRDRGSIKVK
jgi:hypothetical protein